MEKDSRIEKKDLSISQLCLIYCHDYRAMEGVAIARFEREVEKYGLKKLTGYDQYHIDLMTSTVHLCRIVK
jgi:hypothetical protein